MLAREVGRRLRMARGRMTQTEFAGAAGITQEHYSRYERGERLIPDEHLVRLGRAHGKDPESLLFGSIKNLDPTEQAIVDLLRSLHTRDVDDILLFVTAKVEYLQKRGELENTAVEPALEALRRAVA